MVRNQLITTAILILGLYFIFSLSKSTYNLWQRVEKVKEARGRRLEEERKQREFKEKLGFVQSPKFVEREAREKLGLTKPGETVVIVPSLEATQSAQEEILPNWKKWWRLFL